MLQEMGNNWSVQPRDDGWRARLEKELDMSKTSTFCAHNENDKVRSRHQWGGTAILTHGKLKYYSMGGGKDPKNLGRWTWTRYRGKGGMVLRCVSFYRPCSDTGIKSVGAQHLSYFRSKNSDRLPRQAFLEDFEEEIEKWLETGDHLLIGGDINDDVTSDAIRGIFDRLSLRNLIEDRHDLSEAPATYKRNESEESVDGLWATPSLTAKRCGYLEAAVFHGDHAAIWADITFESALGHNPPTPQISSARRQKGSDSKATKKYMRKYKKLCKDAKLGSRIAQFEKQIRPGVALTPKQEKVAEELDSTRTRCMLKAEKACRKIFTGAVEFSNQTDGPRKQIDWWLVAISRRKGVQVSLRMWRRKRKAAERASGEKYTTRHMTIADMVAKKNEALKKYRVASKSDGEARLKFIETFAKKDRDRILKSEAQRKLGRITRMVSGKDASKSVTKVTDTNGAEYETKEEIDNAIMATNEAKCRASDNTPFMKELVSEFGYVGHNDAVNQVLAGTYSPPIGTSRGAKLLLKTMEMDVNTKHSQHQIANKVTVEDHIRGWKKAKERTSSGPSGLHFGLFKANAQEKECAQIDASLRNIAYTTGYVYKRWCKGVDVQILKKSQDFRVEKLRTILLLEADYNMNNKQLGRDVMWKAERDLSLARDNYGGRKRRRAVEVSLNQTLTYNSIWARRGRAVVLSNDARGCFDRIAHQVAYICLLRLGAPKDPLLSTIKTIQQLRHTIRTAFGDSERSYGGDNAGSPLQGLLQGNGLAPPGWAAVSTVLVDAMKAAKFGYNTWSAISKRAIEIVCFAFVDDTDLIHAVDPEMSTEHLIREAQRVLRTWEELLHATGGALAPEKSYWYLIEVIRRNGTWQYRVPDESICDIELQTKDNNGNNIISKRLNCDVAKEALGVFSNPECKMNTQKEEMKKKVAKFCDGVRTKRLSRIEAWHVLNASIMRTLEYPLAATTLTKQELNVVMAPLLKVMLPLCGYQEKFPRKLLYGSIGAQGCGLKDPWILQTIEHLLVILRHADMNTPTGDLLAENMELVQVYVGSERSFWEIPYEDAGHLAPKGWVQHTWKAIDECSLKLHGPLATKKCNRIGDRMLMDVVRESKKFDNKQQIIINNCRMFLGVSRVSDITTAVGNHLKEDAWRGSVTMSQRRDKHEWPGTYNPPAKEWDMWRAMLTRCLIIPHHQHRRLMIPLGKWWSDDIKWEWWFSRESNNVWQRQSDGLKIWSPVDIENNNRNGHRFENPVSVNDESEQSLPSDAVRADIRVSRNGRGIMVVGKATPTQEEMTTSATVESLYDELINLPTSSHWATRNALVSDNGTKIAAALRNGTAVAVSDGSLKSGLGTAAYIVEGENSEGRIFGVNKVPGPIGDGDSYRCELAGLYAIILILTVVAKFHRVPNGYCVIACDNESSLEVFRPDFMPNPQGASFDLVSAIWRLLQESTIEWEAVHVKGHQDDTSKELTRLETMNVKMDHTAKRYWRYLVNSPEESMQPAPCEIYAEGWTIWKGDKKIVQPSRNCLYKLIQDDTTIDWWVRHERISKIAAELIDWHGNGKSLKATPMGIRRWTTKHASHNCGCGTTLVLWKKQDDDECPRCAMSEDTDHVLKCDANGADNVWAESVSKLTEDLQKLSTDPVIERAIVSRIQAWRADQIIAPDEGDVEVQEAVAEQNEIGWRNMIEGLWSKRWSQLQQRYYCRTGSRKTGKKWMEKVSVLLRIAGYKQWKHRNDIKHYKEKPRHKEEEKELDREIFAELIRGQENLPDADKHMFSYGCIQLQQRPVKFKQTWLVNLTMARQRETRKRANDNDIETISRKRSKLFQWIETGRAT